MLGAALLGTSVCLGAQTYTPGTWLVVDNPSKPTQTAEIVLDPGGFLYWKRQSGPNYTLWSTKFKESLFEVRVEKTNPTSLPAPSCMLIPTPSAPVTLKHIVQHPPPTNPPSKIQVLTLVYQFEVDWGGGKKEGIHVQLQITSGGAEIPGEKNIHGKWLDLIRWRISVFYPYDENHAPYSWARWARFPNVRWDVPGENKDHWFIINEQGGDQVHTECTWNYFEMYPEGFDVLRESFTDHPGGTLQFGTNPVHITIHSNSLQGGPEILFHDGATNRPLREREITALLISPT